MRRPWVPKPVRPAAAPALATAAVLFVAAPGAGPLAAQTPAAGGLLFTEVEFGARGYMDRPSETELARFEKFRDAPPATLLEDLRIWWRRDAHLLEVRAREAGQRDQRLGIRSSSLGLYDLRLERDRTPHVLSSTGRILGEEPRPGEFTLPVPRPPLLDHDQGLRIGRTGVRWDTDRLGLDVTPRPDAPFRAEYTRTAKSGARPMGMVFGTAGGNFRQILAPVDETAHAVRLSQEVAGARAQARVSYHFSAFDNHLDAVVSDNPLVERPDVDGALRGRTALAPSNWAHAVSAGGGLNLPRRSRLTGAVSYGWRGQDQALLPHTINARLLAEELPDLPEGLGGDVRTLNLNLSARSRPVAPVAVTARYRRIELDDRTPDVELTSRVRSDQAVVNGPLERRRVPYTRENAALDLRWTPVREVSVAGAYAWDRWERGSRTRNPVETRERIPRLTVDLRPSGRVGLRGSYLRSWRRSEGYVEAHDLPLLRRFDRSDRDQERVRVSLQLFPLDALDLSLGFDRGESTYPDSPYGRQEDAEKAWSAHAGWSVGERVRAHASYVREDFGMSQRSRFRGEIPVELDNETFDWIGNTDEAVRTVGAGGTVSLLPRTLDLTVGFDRSRGSSVMRAHNPLEPASRNVGNRISAGAEDFPAVSHTIRAAHLHLRYRLSDVWIASMRVTDERFSDHDFRSESPNPASGMDVLLGNGLLGYRARYLTMTFAYHPWIPGVRRPPF